MHYKDIIDIFNNLLNDADKLWIKRKRKIDTKLLFYAISDILTNNYGIKHHIALKQLSSNFNYNISDAALCNARKKCHSYIFHNILNKLTNKFFCNKKTANIYAVDGSKFNVPLKFNKFNYAPRNDKSHKNLAMISCIYDTVNNVPFNISLSNHFNERKAFLSQLKFFKQKSIFIFDRGYFSHELVYNISLNKHSYLFRLKNDANKQINDIYKNSKIKDTIITINTKRIRIFKYSINNIVYLCATNLFKYAIKKLSKLYKKRWTVEEGFKVFKSYLKLTSVHSSTHKLLEQEIIIRQILFIISRICQREYNYSNYIVSFKFIIHIFVLFSDSTLNEYNLKHILKTVKYKDIPNRKRQLFV